MSQNQDLDAIQSADMQNVDTVEFRDLVKM